MISMSEVGAFPSLDALGRYSVRFGVYLPGLRAIDGFVVDVRIIHSDDRFNPTIRTRDFRLDWKPGSEFDLWTTTVPIIAVADTNFGKDGQYLYRYQLRWGAPGQPDKKVITRWFTDPFARATEIGDLSAFTLSRGSPTFPWTDTGYKTPELRDLIVYELHVAQFNGTFGGIIERLDYLQSLGVNCLELMPVTSQKHDFDWGYGPLHYFAPNARFGGPEGLKRLVDACHARDMAVILDVVYQHVDPNFPYKLVYQNVASHGVSAAPSPMIGADGPFGPQCDFSKVFTQQYFAASNQHWLTEYHVDGFRYDEVTDLFVSPTDSGYAKLSYDTYRFSLGISRFRRSGSGYSRIIQCAEALSRAREVLEGTFTNAAWQDDLLNKSEAIIQGDWADQDFAHILDATFSGYPQTKTVEDENGKPVDMPVAPFQYIESHDHSQLIVFAGREGTDFLAPGNRNLFYKLQPFAIALLTAQGIPMLWEGQEFADNYPLPGSGQARVGLRRDMHWEYFYDDHGSELVGIYRRLGKLRRSSRALRSRESFFYSKESLQGAPIIAYSRRAAPEAGEAEDFAMVLLNFGTSDAKIALPFPRAGTWREMLDDDVRGNSFDLAIRADGEIYSLTIPSHYGFVFIKTNG